MECGKIKTLYGQSGKSFNTIGRVDNLFIAEK